MDGSSLHSDKHEYLMNHMWKSEKFQPIKMELALIFSREISKLLSGTSGQDESGMWLCFDVELWISR